MILGLPIAAFTTLHVVLSLIGIVAGFVVVGHMLSGRVHATWTALFLATTLLTSVTGFLFPITGFTPALALGAISLAVLALALVALSGFQLSGAWRWIYVVSAVFALYLNTFVGVVQAFQKLAFLQPLAPTQSEPPFVAAQVALLALFAVLGLLALKRFRGGQAAAAPAA
jgi:hypothetical protein